MASAEQTGLKNPAYKGFILLLVLTLIEVGIALLNIYHITHLPKLVIGIIMCAIGLYKAYYIIFEFMHMGHERKVFAWTVLLPFVILIWFIIALLVEGQYYLFARMFH